MNILYYGIAYSVFLLFSSLTLAQNNILQIYRSDTIFSLNPFLTYIEDKEKNYTFEQISSPQGQRNFQPLPKGKANFGYSNSAYWFKFSIQPQVRENTSWLVEFAYPILDEILFFAPDLTKNTQKLTWKKYVLGDKYPFAQRPIKYKNFTIPIDFPANSGNQIYTFYFRIDTQSSTQADLQLVPAKMFFDLKMPEQMLYGHFFGILLVMFCYNFLIFFSLNDRLYLYYCLLILSNGILFGSLSGHFFEYVLPNSPYWANKAVLLSMNLSVVFLQLFTNHFLDLAKYLPLMHKLQKLWAGIAGVFCGLAFLLSYSLVGRLGLLIVILAIASNLVSGVWVWYKGNKSARFFLLAFSSFLLAVIVLIFRNLTLLPTNIFTSHAVEIGNALQVTLFSLALGDRYRLYKKQKEEAQAEALRIQLEANEQLERKVEERTRKLKEMTEELQMLNEELNSTNEELVTNIELVQTQSQKLREVNQLLQEWQKNMQDSIAYALQIQTAMLQFDTKNLQYFHSYFILWLPRDVVSG
ncbi:MAG: hypothetical protein NZ516_12725, partial [Raineya sp.]|nr:hypothetical protein [Raineya sp.]